MAQPLINGEAQAWSSISVTLFGTPIVGFTAINYDDEQEIEDNYGAGNYPVSRGFGNVKAKASITLLAEENDKIVAVAPEGRLNLIPEFDIIVQYIRPGTATIITHTIRNCRFTGNKREAKQGDKKLEVQHDLVCSHIDWI